MSTTIGNITSIEGKFYAESADGSVRELSVGDDIYEGEVVVGDKNNNAVDNVLVSLDDGSEISLIGDETQLFDLSLFSDDFAADETTTENDSIQALLDENPNLYEDLDDMEYGRY